MKRTILLLILSAAVTVAGHAADFAPFVEAGNAQYDADDYPAALDSFDKAIYLGNADGIVRYKRAWSYKSVHGDGFKARLDFLRAFQALRIQNPNHRYVEYASKQIFSDDPVENLRMAVELSDGNRVKALLAAKADPNALDPSGVTPYAAALRLGDKAVIGMLERAGGRIEDVESFLPVDAFLTICSRETARAAFEMGDTEIGRIVLQEETVAFFEPLFRSLVEKAGTEIGEDGDLKALLDLLDLLRGGSIADFGMAFHTAGPRDRVDAEILPENIGFQGSVKAVDAGSFLILQSIVETILAQGGLERADDSEGMETWKGDGRDLYLVRGGTRISFGLDAAPLRASLARLKEGRREAVPEEPGLLRVKVDLGFLLRASGIPESDGTTAFLDLLDLGDGAVLDLKAGIRDRKINLNASLSVGGMPAASPARKPDMSGFDLIPAYTSQFTRVEADPATGRNWAQTLAFALDKQGEYDGFLSRFAESAGVELWDGFLMNFGPSILGFDFPGASPLGREILLLECRDGTMLDRMESILGNLGPFTWKKAAYGKRTIHRLQCVLGETDKDDPLALLATLVSGAAFVRLDGWIAAARTTNDLKDYLDWHSSKGKATARSLQDVMKGYESLGTQPLFYAWNDPSRNAAFLHESLQAVAAWMEGIFRGIGVDLDMAGFPRASAWIPYLRPGAVSLTPRGGGLELSSDLGFPSGGFAALPALLGVLASMGTEGLDSLLEDAGLPTIGSAKSPADQDLKIAILVPLTGNLAFFGTSARDGALLAIEEWNANGGVLGRKILPIVEDSGCDPEVAVPAARRVIEEEGVRFILGDVCSTASIPVSELAEAAGVVQISPSATVRDVTVGADGTTKRHVFRACFIDSYQGLVGARFAVQELGAARAFVLFDPQNGYSADLVGAFETEFRGLGGEIVGRGTYSQGDGGFSAVLSRARKADPDLIYLPDYGAVVNAVMAQARKMGIDAPFLGGDGWDTPELDLEAAAGGFFLTRYCADAPTGEAEAFRAAYGARYADDQGRPAVPDALAALSYDAVNALLTAIAAAETDDTDMVASALEAQGFFGVTGLFRFDDRHDPVKEVTILEVVAGGTAPVFRTTVGP